MADLEEPLLKARKVYPDCPGCKVAHLAVDGAPPPYRSLFFVGVVVLCNVLPICSLYPFVYFMVQDFGIAKADEDIGFYAGFIGSSFMFGRFFTSVQWGIAADRFGRRPVMIASVSSVIIFNTIFGASTSFWMAIISRFLLGCFNGSLGPVKAYASEICSDEHQALGVATVGTTWGLGLILGPAIGGYFSQPALKYPSLFPPGSLFDKFPYLLPSLITSAVAVVGLCITLYLPETVHIHREQVAVSEDDIDHEKGQEEATHSKDVAEDTEKAPDWKQKTSTWSLLQNRPLMGAITVYCVWSLHDMAYTEIFSLYAVSPKSAGGLGFTTTDVGNVLTISGAALLTFQLSTFPILARRLGAINITRAATVLSLPLLCAYPPIAGLHGAAVWVALILVSITKNVLGTATMSGSFLLINNSVKPSQRGAANGLSVSLVSLFKAIGPGAGGAIFAWAQRRHSKFLPGNQMVFFVLGLVALAAAICTTELFLPKSLDKTMHEEEDE